jgi:hypothetical protein
MARQEIGVGKPVTFKHKVTGDEVCVFCHRTDWALEAREHLRASIRDFKPEQHEQWERV